MEQHVKQLRSVDPNQRRAAIIALARTGSPRALEALAYVYRTDPDPALRELALQAGRRIQQQAISTTPLGASARAAPEAPPAPAVEWPRWTDERAGAMPGRAAPVTDSWRPSWQGEATDEPPPAPEPEKRVGYVGPGRQRMARGELRQAFSFVAAGDRENALAALARAVTVDPALTGDPSARRLVADLLASPPRQAMTMLLNKVASGEIKTSTRKAGTSAALGTDFSRRLVIFAVEMPILFLVLTLFVFTYSYRIRNSVSVPDIDFILPGVLSMISRSTLARALPLAFASLVAVLFFVVVVFFVGVLASGTGPFLRFLTVMTAVQIVVFAVIGVGMLVVPFAIFVPTGTPGQYIVQFHVGWMFVGGIWVLSIESYFTGRAHELDLIKGGTITIVGFVASSILGGLLGIFRGSLFG